MTAANSTPLSDGASAVLLASEEWAKERDLPILAYVTEAQTAAVDHVHKREGLLMAPAYAMPAMLDRAGLALQDFDYYEIHEAFAAQVLCTLKAWEDPAFCKEKLGREEPLGAIDRAKLNVNGGSLAAAHPFAATGGRIVAGLAKQLHEDGKRPRRDQHLRRRRPGRRRDPRERREVPSHERPLLAARQRAGRLDHRQAARPAAAGRPRPLPGRRRRSSPARCSPAPRPAAGSASSSPRLLDQIKAERAGAEGPAKALVFDATGIADSTELVELQRFFYPAVGRLQRSGRVVVLGTPPARGRLGPRPHRPAGAGGLHPLARQGDRRPRRAPRSSSTSRPAPRTSSTRPCASCSRRARPTSPARWCGSATASRRRRSSTGSGRWAARSALVTGASRGIGAAIADDPGPRRRRGRRARRAAGRGRPANA